MEDLQQIVARFRSALNSATAFRLLLVMAASCFAALPERVAAEPVAATANIKADRVSSNSSRSNSVPQKPTKPPAAKMKIRGYGLFGDLQLKKLIRTLVLNEKKPEVYDANMVDDAALI